MLWPVDVSFRLIHICAHEQFFLSGIFCVFITEANSILYVALTDLYVLKG